MAIQVMRKENVFVFGTHGLTQSTSTANDPITDDPSPELVSNRNGDARNLILSNKNLIAAEAVERMISTSSTQKFTPSGATYNPTTGDFVITSAAHGLTAATSETATGATYTPADGKLLLTLNNHGFTNGQKILIKDGSLTLKCAMDANATEHSYPRSTDPAYNKVLGVETVSTDVLTVNVGVASANNQSSYPRATGANTTSGADYAHENALTVTDIDADTFLGPKTNSLLGCVAGIIFLLSFNRSTAHLTHLLHR